MPARYMPWLRVRPCPFVSVTSRCFIETVERFELVFGVGHRSFLRLILPYVIRNLSTSKNMGTGTSLWNFDHKLGT